MADIFVSYASEDRERVAPIAAFLESQGWTVWWDRRLDAGTSFDREIERELDAASCVLVAWSRASIESDWVRTEAQEGMDRGVLVPILLDSVRPPLAFRRIQAQDISDGLTPDAQGDLTQAVSRAAGKASAPGADEGIARGNDASAHTEQEVRFTRAADGVRIAWARTGSGPPLVRVINWASNLETEWSQPSMRNYIDLLSEKFTLIRYNGRGGGLSERRPDFTFEFGERYSDLEAVIEACGEERVALFGISEGAPAAVTWAARNPERVSHLVLLGAANVLRRDNETSLAGSEWLPQMVAACWGQENVMQLRLIRTLFGFDLPGADIEDQALVRALRSMHSQDDIGRLFTQIIHTADQIDLRELAPRVKAPTLIIHSRNDVLVSAVNSQWLAARIPDARLMLIDSKNHGVGFVGSYDELVTREIKAFIGV